MAYVFYCIKYMREYWDRLYRLILHFLIFRLPKWFRYGKIYLKAAKSCLEKGADYANNEVQRLERMLKKVSFALPDYVVVVCKMQNTVRNCILLSFLRKTFLLGAPSLN